MQKATLRFGNGFKVILGNRRAQAATMTIAPADSEGERHEIRNTGRTPLRTLNLYVPPAYTKAGDELPRGRK